MSCFETNFIFNLVVGVHVAKSTILGGARNGGNFKRGAKIYRVFSISAVHALHTVIWMWGDFLFCCCFGTYLWQRNFPSVVLGVFHQQLSLVPTVSIFCSLNGSTKSSSWCLCVVLGFPLAAVGVSLLLSCSHFLCLWCLSLSGSWLATGS